MGTLRSITETHTETDGKKTTTIRRESFTLKGDEDYIKCYLSDMYLLLDILDKNPKSLKLLLAILKRLPYCNEISQMSVSLNLETRKVILKEVGISSEKVLDKYLKALLDTRILFRVRRGQYIPNPYIFGRGDAHQIKLLRKYIQSLIDKETISEKNIRIKAIKLSDSQAREMKIFEPLFRIALDKGIPSSKMLSYVEKLRIQLEYPDIPQWLQKLFKER